MNFMNNQEQLKEDLKPKIKIRSTNDQEFGYVKILLMGEAGTGKTTAIGTLPESETLYVNITQESGAFTLRNKNFDLVDVSSLDDMRDVVELLKTDTKYQYVAIDSFSQFQKTLKEHFEKQAGYSGKQGEVFKMWRDVAETSKKIVDAFKKLNKHVIFTSEVKKDKDEELGTFIYTTSLQGSAKDDLPYWVDEVYFMSKTGKAGEKPKYKMLTDAGEKYPCKSRANVLDVVIENPNLYECIKKFKKGGE